MLYSSNWVVMIIMNENLITMVNNGETKETFFPSLPSLTLYLF